MTCRTQCWYLGCMLKTTLPPLRPEWVVCPNAACGATDRIGVHSHTERRYKCHACGKTFAETVGTPFYGLKHPTWLVVLVLTLLAYGCPIPAIVAAFTLDERTVAAWHQKAGQQAKAVQAQVVCQGHLDLGQVQGDELYVKTQRGTVWMATAMSVFARLWLWGAVAPQRDTALITQVVQRVRAAAQVGRPILWAVDGFAAWTTTILKVFRDPMRTGKRGRPPLVVWPDLHIVQHRVHRTAQCHLADLAARADAPQPHRRAGGGAPGSRHVLDRLCLQFLSGPYNAPGDTGDGRRSHGSCLVRG